MTGEVWTVVVAAGSGRRFGAAKQFVPLGGRPLVAWAIEAALAVSDGVVVVLPDGVAELPDGTPDVQRIVAGGATRSASVRAGLTAVPSTAEVVLVHDGARPMADEALFRRLLDAVGPTADAGEPGSDRPAGAAVPGVAVADTLRSRDGVPVDRDTVVAVQTPQAFRAEVLRRAHAGGGEATDDATLCEELGARVVVVEGDPSNLKVTTPSDLAVAESLLAARSPSPLQVGDFADEATTHAASNRDQLMTPELRVGNGFDIHRFSDDPSRRCVLGGVEIPDSPGFEAHSDGDVVAHAVADALLGAVGQGDIGAMFPDTDPTHAGADSMELLDGVVARLARDGWRALNVDCSVIAERPKLAPHRPAMVERLSAVVGAPVSVKGRRAEGVGSLGSGEAVVALASALVVRS
ncbi:MAG: 2-C-methyl-D-erythritol 4-phosphate cytidylyltransferase [Microthrixaceae bacterium]